MSTLSGSAFLLLCFAFVQCSFVNAECFNCDSPGLDLSLIIGLVVGIFALLTLLSLVFVCWRRNRIRNFQRTYVENRQAQVFAAQQVQQNYQAELNAQYSNYLQGWQPVSAPEPVHQHHQAHPQHHIQY
ncbi:uncharacterized protein EV420DRAFT_891577 [Desarmillaria tabescens]|uniref:Uncharacterized protein n=1 Tax=Armillaria tabescens TaxID=1929756 RepID=A0AA39MH02_ARMTA|nr:uncharacterized protein EV420DRAFT_487603 [Desarmillaria tabescens]XP_060325861.1 uncharacterized protein EV420DRAFT_891577 [Desarmillaria tabescens]KAK0433937.1 hypothetical protein EV420DRAFT_487603 [Desarmillaria tabescens]KAK0446512.1 hypothetical protein EV420DRAFT_891577 [Desarmillaria tabescens]